MRAAVRRCSHRASRALAPWADTQQHKWFADKGFGFGKVQSGEVSFIHASAVQGAEVLMIGTDAWARCSSTGRRKGLGRSEWKEEMDKERASKVAEQVRRVAALTAELAAEWEKKLFEVCSHPPGLRDEPAEHIVAPNMGAGGSHLQAAMMQAQRNAKLLATVSPFLASGSPLPASLGFFAPRLRGAQRASHARAMVDEALDFHVKATGEDEDRMRQLEKMRPGELRRSHERGEHVQRKRSASTTRRRKLGTSVETKEASR